MNTPGQKIPEADSESGTLKVREETYCVDFSWHFLTKQQEVSPKHRKCCPGGVSKAWRSFDVYHKRSCSGDASVEFRYVLLTGTGVSMAGLGLSPIALAVLASQLRHRSVTVTYSGDLPFPTSHRAWWPRRPQTPASVLPNWDLKNKLIINPSAQILCSCHPLHFHPHTYTDFCVHNTTKTSLSPIHAPRWR